MRGSINGYVVRADNEKPVVGATVSIVQGAGPVPDIAPVTDVDGYFGLDGLSAGEWVLNARGPNGSMGEATVPVFDNAVSDITIKLNGLSGWLANALTGVIDGSVDVASEDSSSPQHHSSIDQTRGGRSNGSNRSASNAERHMNKGLARRTKDRQVSSVDKLPVVAPGSVRGRVVLADTGMPVSDATISVVKGVGPAPDIAPMTDAAGRFYFEGLTPGAWVLSALGPNGEHGEATVRVYDNASADVIIETERQSAATGCIWGRVVVAQNGMPVPDATVSVVSGAGPAVWTDLVTDIAGRFFIDGVTPGMWVLRAAAPESGSGEATVRVNEEPPTYLIIEIEEKGVALGSVRGRVVLADTGMPVSDATISVVKGVGPAPDIAPMTDAAGRFYFEGLTPGAWVLSALGPNGEHGEAKIRVVERSAADLTIMTDRVTQAVELIGRPCRIYHEGDALTEDIAEERVNIEVERTGDRIKRIWFG